jgi:DNA-binding NarL/FixJ family response regulator
MAAALQPEVIITDLAMPEVNGLDAIRRIRECLPRTGFVVLTMHADPHLAAEAFRAGASAYILKISAGEELVHAVREVCAGRAYLTSLIARDLLSVLIEARSSRAESEDRLTPRQREVLQLVVQGRTMKEVAASLGISQRTAESHKYDMMQALGVRTTAALIQYALQRRIIPG